MTAGLVRTYRARVGYVDTDQAGIAHHSTYFRWFEQARVEFLREGGLVYRDWERACRTGLPVVDARVRYLAPVRFDEIVLVETRIGAAARVAIRFDHRCFVEGRPEPVTDARIRLACVHLETGLREMPDEVLRACLGAGFEALLEPGSRTRVT